MPKGIYRGRDINTHSRRKFFLNDSNVPLDDIRAAIARNAKEWYKPGGELNPKGVQIYNNILPMHQNEKEAKL